MCVCVCVCGSSVETEWNEQTRLRQCRGVADCTQRQEHSSDILKTRQVDRGQGGLDRLDRSG